MTLKLTGSGISPFVRKVRVVLAEKGIEYEHDPMPPINVSDEYKQKHPMGKIPLLEDGDRVIPDSSAISAYLERTHPQPALYPEDPYDYARALWIEEYADSALISVASIPFVERVIGKIFFKQQPDEDKIRKSEQEDLPPVADYLERTLGGNDYFIGNRFSIADIAVGTAFANFFYGDGQLDAGRWPKLAAHVERVHARPSFKELLAADRQGIDAMRG